MKPVEHTGRRPFEGVDLSAAGKRGGIASGASRRQAPMRELNRTLEEKILASKSGWAHVRLLEIRLAREAEEDRARAEAGRDRAVALRDRAQAELAEVQAEHAELRRQLDEEIAGLELRASELRLRAATDEDLIELLRELGEQRVERACIGCGWFEAEAEVES